MDVNRCSLALDVFEISKHILSNYSIWFSPLITVIAMLFIHCNTMRNERTKSKNYNKLVDYKFQEIETYIESVKSDSRSLAGSEDLQHVYSNIGFLIGGIETAEMDSKRFQKLTRYKFAYMNLGGSLNGTFKSYSTTYGAMDAFLKRIKC